MQNSESNNASEPSTNNDLENRLNNSSNLSRRRFIKYLVFAASASALGIFLTSKVAKDPGDPSNLYPETTPQTPPPYTTPVHTATPKPTPAPTQAPSSLESIIPPNGPLSPEQISQYTLIAYETAYNDGKFDQEKRDQAERCLGKVIDAVVDSIFEEKKLGYEYPGYDEYLALAITAAEYLEGRKLSGESLEGLKNSIRKDTVKQSKKDKDAVSDSLKDWYIGTHLGASRGALS